MKIIRFRNPQGDVHEGCQREDGQATVIEGDIYGDFRDTGQPVIVDKLLAPIAPVDIICIGLN